MKINQLFSTAARVRQITPQFSRRISIQKDLHLSQSFAPENQRQGFDDSEGLRGMAMANAVLVDVAALGILIRAATR
jgi:hypothetical protein